jgi:hypothetical protein
MAKPPGHQTPDLYSQTSGKFDTKKTKSKSKSKGKRGVPRGKPSKPRPFDPMSTDISPLFKEK